MNKKIRLCMKISICYNVGRSISHIILYKVRTNYYFVKIQESSIFSFDETYPQNKKINHVGFIVGDK